MKYIERLQASNEELDQQQAAGRAAEARADLDSKIAAQEASITRLSNQVDSILNRYPLEIDVIMKNQDKVTQAEKQLEDLKTIREALFGAE